MLAFWYYLNLKIKVDTVVHHIYFDSKYHVKYKFVPKLCKDVDIINLVHYGKTRLCAASVFSATVLGIIIGSHDNESHAITQIL